MPVASTARAWLASPTPPPPTPRRSPAVRDDVQDLSADGKATSATTTQPRRQWPNPVSANEQDRCCARLGCVQKFTEDATSFLARTLAQEQDFIRLCSTREDRKRFVLDRVPVIHLGPGQGSMIAAGIPVCNMFFKKSFGVSSQLIDACKGTPNARASPNPERTSTSGVGGSCPKREAVLSFTDTWIDNFGQFMPHKDLIVIAGSSNAEFYQEFLKELDRVHPGDRSKIVSKVHFYRILRRERRNVRVKNGGDFMKCDLCVTSKEVLRASSGGTKATHDPETRHAAREKLNEHYKDVRADRLEIAKSTAAAFRAKADGKPLDFVFMAIDAANQTSHALPALYPPTHGSDRGYPERQKIMSAHVEGQFVDVFFTPQYLGGGCNLACTAAHLAITHLLDTHDKGTRHPSGYIIQHAHWQVDNCVSENKNNYFLGYAGLLVAASIIRVVEINFMMVGHTHMKIDQIFSRFSRGIKGKNIFTRNQLAGVLQASYTELPVNCSTLRNQGNFKGLLQGRVNRVPDITTYRAFRIEKGGDGRVKVRVKHHMHGTEWKGIGRDGDVDPDAPAHDLFIGHPPRIQDAPPYELKKVPDEVIRKVEQRYLASHERLAAAYPLDGAGAQRVKNEQMDSVRRLKETGEREFDLPVHWLPDDYDGAESDVGSGGPGDGVENEDSSGGPGDGGEGDETDASDSDAEEADFCRRSRPRANTDRNVVSVKEGSFAFFVARGAPFLVGRIVAESVGPDGERGVDLHWFRPTNDHTRDNAASLTLDEYHKSTFVEGYVMVASDGIGRSGKTKRVKDVSWEPVERIVATSEKLVGNGKKIPNKVLKVLRSVTGDRGSASGEREVQGRHGEEGKMRDVIGGGERPSGMEDENEDQNETGEQRPENDSESAEPDQEMGNLGTSRPEGGGCGEGVGGSSNGAETSRREDSLQGAVEESALDTDRGSDSAGVRKRPHPDTQLPQPNSRFRLTAAHFRPRRR